MKLKLAVVAFLSGLIAISSAEARGPYGSISVGNWQGGAFTNDQTGAFSHCAAGAAYDSGIYFMVTIDRGCRLVPGLPAPEVEFHHQSGVPDRPDVRRSGAVQCSRRGHRSERGPRAHAGRLRADCRVSQGQDDVGLCARSPIPVQARSDGSAAAHAGQLCRDREAAGRRECAVTFRSSQRRRRSRQQADPQPWEEA